MNVISNARFDTVGARLDRLPIAGFHHKLLWLVGLGMFFDTFDIYLAGGVIAAMTQEGFTNVDLNAIFISVTFLGMTVGAFLAGMFGDYFGRKFTYQFNLLIVGIASLAAALAPSMIWLIVFRGIMGLGLGAEIVIGFGTLTEFVPARSRGKWLSALSFINNSSLVVASGIGYWVIPILGWRYMFVIVGIGALIVLYFRKAIPESPRWYKSRGMHEEAEKVLLSIENQIETEKGAPLPKVNPAASAGSEIMGEKSSIWELFTPPLLRNTIVSCLIFVALSVAMYVFVVWLPSIFLKQGVALSNSLGYVAIISLGGPIGSAFGFFIADRFSRKWTSIGLALFCALLGYLYSAVAVVNISVLLVLGFLLIAGMYAYNAIAFALYVPELFPTRLRMRGCGIANTAGRLFTIFTPFAVAFLLTHYSAKPVFLIIPLVFVIDAVCIAIWGIETGAKSLEEIELVD